MGYEYEYLSPYGYGGGYSVGPRYSMFASGLVLLLSTAIMVYVVAQWIFRSIGLYHMAKDRGIAHAWFAWVPILDKYILGRLINNKVVLGDSIVLGHAEFFLPFIAFLGLSSTTYGRFGSIIMAAVWVYNISALWRLFKIYRPKNRTSYTVWSAIIGSGFFIFAIRNDKPFDPLEPNKVYQNFYGEKRIVEHNYKEVEDNIKAQEDAQIENLKEAYDKKLENPELNADEQAVLHKDYREAKDHIEDVAEAALRMERQDEYQEIEHLKEEMVPETDESDAVEAAKASHSMFEQEDESTVENIENVNVFVDPVIEETPTLSFTTNLDSVDSIEEPIITPAPEPEEELPTTEDINETWEAIASGVESLNEESSGVILLGSEEDEKNS